MYRSIYIPVLFLGLISFFWSCNSTPPPPPLTYSGEEPRVQNPLSPEDSRLHIQVPKGFEVELFAAEPNIINPIAFTWDERGRLWVVQSMDYPHGLDNEVGGDRITICEDTDGDGKADLFKDFAKEQSLTTGITKVKGGIIVAQAPHIVFLADRDGDDQMDDARILFSGFGTWDTHAGPSSLRYGLDNQIWGAVGYSGFEQSFGGDPIEFKMGVYKFSMDGTQFEPVGRFNNNTWGMGFNDHYDVFGSTANNNHACYVGIPLKYYDYLDERPDWAINADFIQGHYEITPPDSFPLQQVDVRGGYTAAAGANFYTARNFPEKYWNQMLVNEPTGHIVHLAEIHQEGAGYIEKDGGNIFASTDAWTAPVFTETGPDGNLWIADWYNPVIQHNPDKRGMENQIWNDIKGEGNAHLNDHRDKRHGRIYILKYKRKSGSKLKSLDADNPAALLEALKSDNQFWRITAQRLIVENQHTELIPQLEDMAKDVKAMDKTGLNAAALHALWTLEGLNAFSGQESKLMDILSSALSNPSYAVASAALDLIPNSLSGSELLAESGLLESEDLRLRLKARLRASDLPETGAIHQLMSRERSEVASDKWLNAASNIYFRVENKTAVDLSKLEMVIQTADKKAEEWKYTVETPDENWMMPDYSDRSWKTGQGLFAGKGKPKMKTPWETKDIYLRKTFTISSDWEEPVLKIMHDNDYKVFINGTLLYEESGVSAEYKYIKLEADKAQLFKKGKNVIAVHCHDSGGDRHIDVGLGKIGEPKADIVFNLNTVSQKMAFDQTVLRAKAGQTVQINLNNRDEMPHNLVVIQPESLPAFGQLVDEFLKDPKAAEMGYVPQSRYVLSATSMLEPGKTESIVFQLPDQPGIYPFVCTFPGHWRMMQGVILVEGPGTYLSEAPEAPVFTVMGGGGSHDFEQFFGVMDGKIMSAEGQRSVYYTEDSRRMGDLLDQTDVLFLSNNKPIDGQTRKKIFERVASGMNLLIYHPSTWYNWKDWPEYNRQLVGGGSTSHEKLQNFEVEVVQPDHPLMKDVPAKFRIFDELYRWKADPEGAEIEVLAIGRGLESGETFPVVWTVKHPKAKIVANTLGHDARAHTLPAYQQLLKNAADYVATP